MILKGWRQGRPTHARSREYSVFFNPPLNIRPYIVQIISYMCVLSLKLEFKVGVFFSLLADQSGIYVRLEIHTLPPPLQHLKTLLLVVVWFGSCHSL